MNLEAQNLRTQDLEISETTKEETTQSKKLILPWLTTADSNSYHASSKPEYGKQLVQEEVALPSDIKLNCKSPFLKNRPMLPPVQLTSGPSCLLFKNQFLEINLVISQKIGNSST